MNSVYINIRKQHLLEYIKGEKKMQYSNDKLYHKISTIEAAKLILGAAPGVSYITESGILQISSTTAKFGFNICENIGEIITGISITAQINESQSMSIDIYTTEAEDGTSIASAVELYQGTLEFENEAIIETKELTFAIPLEIKEGLTYLAAIRINSSNIEDNLISMAYITTKRTL